MAAPDPDDGAGQPVDTTPPRQLTPLGLYSHAADVSSRLPQMRGTPQQFKAMLLKQGVKPDELKWSNYDKAHEGKKLITREELKQHFDQNLPRLQESVLGGYESARERGHVDENGTRHVGLMQPPKYSEYTLPGGKNYREVVLHLPAETRAKEAPARWRDVREHNGQWFRVAHPPEEGTGEWDTVAYPSRDAAIMALVPPRVSQVLTDNNFQSSHWDEPNVVAHLRLSDRSHSPPKGSRDANGQRRTGQKVLHLEEMQSDWGQKGREEGFKLTPTARGRVEPQEGPHGFWRIAWPDGTFSGGYGSREAAEGAETHRHEHGGVPIAPYVDSTSKWTDLGLKRALYEAAKGGYDRLVITPGEEQAKRYDLANHIEAIHVHDNPTHKDFDISLKHKGGDWADQISTVSYDQLHQHVGRDLAEKILADRGQHTNTGRGAFSKEYNGLDLKVGGEGMKAYYDKIVPTQLEKLAKKHDPAAKVMLHEHTLNQPKMSKRYMVANRGSSWRVIDTHSDGGEYVGGHFPTQAAAQAHRRLLEPAETKLHSLDITPKMRASILRGQPAFAAGGAV